MFFDRINHCMATFTAAQHIEMDQLGHTFIFELFYSKMSVLILFFKMTMFGGNWGEGLFTPSGTTTAQLINTNSCVMYIYLLVAQKILYQNTDLGTHH